VRGTIQSENQARQDSLRVLAETTGGRAVLNSNTANEALPAIFEESSSYYVLGFQSADQKRDGRLHKIEVKVARRGVDVRTHSGFSAPGGNLPPGTPESPLAGAVKELLPKTGLRLSAVAMPFAARNGKGGTVLVALRVRQAATEPAGPAPQATGSATEHVEIFTSAFDRNGRSPGWLRQTLDVSSGERGDGTLQYDAVASLELPPGSYQIRVAAGHRNAARVGSVHTEVTVPDFTREPLSLSGLVLDDAATAPATPAEVFSALLPVSPTSRREFATADRVTAFMRVYQGGGGPLAPVRIRAQVVDTGVKVTFDETSTLERDEFGLDRAADFRLELPLQRLAPGAYLLTVEATLGTHVTRRDVRLTVR
jgi:hypothetical protein